MILAPESLINIDLKITADDALRTYLVLGRTNGSIKGFSESLYSVLAEALGIESFKFKYKLHDLARHLSTIQYYNIQGEAEKIFFGDHAKRNELAEKVAQLEKLQAEVSNLKNELGDV